MKKEKLNFIAFPLKIKRKHENNKMYSVITIRGSIHSTRRITLRGINKKYVISTYRLMKLLLSLSLSICKSFSIWMKNENEWTKLAANYPLSNVLCLSKKIKREKKNETNKKSEKINRKGAVIQFVHKHGLFIH